MGSECGRRDSRPGRTPAAGPGESTESAETALSKADGEPANGRNPVGVGAGGGLAPAAHSDPA